MVKELIALDLFCGCGGFTLGLTQAGIKVKYAIDNDPKVQDTFEKNLPGTKFVLADIRDESPMSYKSVNVVVGGPPCQPFSVANNTPDPEAGMELVLEFLRFIRSINPKYWIMENVPQVAPLLDDLWFKIPKIKVLNCANYGIPQKRKRCFSGRYIIPPRSHHKHAQHTLFEGKLEKWVTAWEAIKDIIFIEPNQKTHIREYQKKRFLEKHPPLDLSQPAKTVTTKDDFAILNHQCFDNINPEWVLELANRKVRLDKPAPTITTKERTSHILTFTSARNPETSGGNSVLFKSNECGRTITGSPPSIVNDAKVIMRRFTVRECARFQTFPDDFEFLGSLTNQYQMVGNAVPPLMSYKLGLALTQAESIRKITGRLR